MKVYLSSRYSRVNELNQYAEDLHRLGHSVTARWLQALHKTEADAQSVVNAEGSVPEVGARFASGDIEDIQNADAFIAFSEEPRSDQGRGGRHVEFGIALALGKRLIVVGPRENLFHCLPQVEVCGEWAEALYLLK